MTNTYNFKVYFKDNTTKVYKSTSLQTLYEYFLYTPRLDVSIDDIDHIELVRQYKYFSYKRDCMCMYEVDETLYNKLANEYLLDKSNLNKHDITSIDAYIKYVLSFNL